MEKQSKKIIVVVFIVGVIFAGLKLILWPVLAEVHFKKGLKAKALMEYRKAEIEFKMATNFRKEPVYYENLAGLYRVMGEVAKDRRKGRGYYEKSVYFYKKLISMSPNNALAYNGLGSTCLYIGRDFREDEFYRSAIENFKKAVKLEPKFTEAYVNLATAYYLWGLKDKAINSYLEALNTNPQDTSIYFNLGMLYFLEKNYEKAQEYWKKVMEINPGSIDAQRGLQMIREAKGKK